MKKLILAGILSAGTIAALAQGTVNFANVQNTGSQQTVFHIYAPFSTGSTVQQIGNATTAFAFATGFYGGDDPVGGTVTTLPGGSGSFTYATANWSGWVAVGGSSGANSTMPINYSFGNNFSFGLLAAAGDNASLNPQNASQLMAGPYPALYTTSPNAAGLLQGSDTITVPVVAGGPIAADYQATVAVVAWWNANGTISFAQAQTTPGDVWGMSNPVNMDSLGEPASITGNVAGVPENLVGIESFNMITTATPEPGTIALGLVGVCGFLARRRKK